jgi:hypothetical protein
MRLYELAGSMFQDDLLNILKVMQGRAISKHSESVISWTAINNLLMPRGHGRISKEILEKIQDQLDPDGSIIQLVDDFGITLNTGESDAPEEEPLEMPGSSAKSVDQMAHNVVQKELK